MPPARPASLKVRALQWLAQREHSRQELRDKLLHLLRRQVAGAARPGNAAGVLEDPDTEAQRPRFNRTRSAGLDADADVNVNADALADADADADADAGPHADTPPADLLREVEAVLDWLAARGHLSDARFIESRVNARQARHGSRRIAQELQQHGLGLDADARQALAATEYQRACQVWQRKYGQVTQDAAERVRQLRFLAGRGFAMDVVQRVVRHGVPPDTSGGDDT